MSTFQIFGLQFLLSLIVYALIARWYLAPRLATLPLASALMPLLLLHAFRHLGMVFLVPAVVGPSLPRRSPSPPRTATCWRPCSPCWRSPRSGPGGARRSP